MMSPGTESNTNRQQAVPGLPYIFLTFLITAIFAIIFFVPVMIVNFIYAFAIRPNAIEINKSRGEAIMSKCLELGVPLKDYYQITWNLMDIAKQKALEMGEPDGEYSDESWNTRLAYAIAEIYFELQDVKSPNPRDS